MAKWFKTQEEIDAERDADAGKSVEAKFGEVDTTLKTVVEAQTKTTGVLESLSQSVKAINDRYKAEDDARVKREKELKAKADAERVAPTADEEFERMASDPAGYVREHSKAGTQLAMITAGKQVRAEVLGDKEYYTGEFKSQVDALIESEQNLALRANPAFINNCYKIILADNFDKITKGELKKNASMHSFSDGSGSGNRSSDPNAKPTIEYRDSKTKYAASQLGLKDEDLVDAAKSGSIHGLEVVA